MVPVQATDAARDWSTDPNHAYGRAGFAKGTFTYIAPDFDAPLDDFANFP